jgi:diacylglycerol kinase
MKNSKQKPFSVKSRIKSFSYAFNGIYQTFLSQHNFWIHLVIMTLVVFFGFLFDLSIAEWLLVLICIGFVLSAEIFNSAIEVLVDIVSPNFSKKAGLVKDMAAAAVLVSAIVSAIVGLFIFVPKFLELL